MLFVELQPLQDRLPIKIPIHEILTALETPEARHVFYMLYRRFRNDFPTPVRWILDRLITDPKPDTAA